MLLDLWEMKYIALYLKVGTNANIKCISFSTFLIQLASQVFLQNSSVILAITLKSSWYKADLKHNGSWQQFTFQIIFCWLGLASRNDTTHWRITYIYVINKLFLSIPTAMKTLSGGLVFTPRPWDEILKIWGQDFSWTEYSRPGVAN